MNKHRFDAKCVKCNVPMARANDLVYRCFYNGAKIKTKNPVAGWRCPICGLECFDRKSLDEAKLEVDDK